MLQLKHVLVLLWVDELVGKVNGEALELEPHRAAVFSPLRRRCEVCRQARF
jgi:hypothetical protein